MSTNTPGNNSDIKAFWNKTPVKTNPLKRIVRTVGFVMLAGLVMAGGTYLYQYLTADKPLKGENLEFYDPESSDTFIEPSNSIQMTFDKAEKASPTLWQSENNTLTIILPIIFKDSRIPILHIEKNRYPDGDNDTKDLITIGGLQEGDIIVSPIDGTFSVSSENLASFFLHGQGSDGEEINITFATTGLNPLINFTLPETGGYTEIQIKKGDLVGSFLTSEQHSKFAGQVMIAGHGPFLKNFNLASTSDGKAIILK
ncbi:MAG: hypothetical protein JW712_04790 [Dehalococcoidales bacterium]|nr:hypothetical protein [Dehalococcoidales bacterium]